jgi:hypothetical protein
MNPLFYVQNQELIEIKATKKPIGGGQIGEETERVFDLHEVILNSNDTQKTTLYLCSDGYQDQFGGLQGKKFMTGRFKKLLTEIEIQTMQEQVIILDTTIKNWILEGNEKQIDDILVMGLRV